MTLSAGERAVKRRSRGLSNNSTSNNKHQQHQRRQSNQDSSSSSSSSSSPTSSKSIDQGDPSRSHALSSTPPAILTRAPPSVSTSTFQPSSIIPPDSPFTFYSQATRPVTPHPDSVEGKDRLKRHHQSRRGDSSSLPSSSTPPIKTQKTNHGNHQSESTNLLPSGLVSASCESSPSFTSNSGRSSPTTGESRSTVEFSNGGWKSHNDDWLDDVDQEQESPTNSPLRRAIPTSDLRSFSMFEALGISTTHFSLKRIGAFTGGEQARETTPAKPSSSNTTESSASDIDGRYLQQPNIKSQESSNKSQKRGDRQAHSKEALEGKPKGMESPSSSTSASSVKISAPEESAFPDQFRGSFSSAFGHSTNEDLLSYPEPGSRLGGRFPERLASSGVEHEENKRREENSRFQPSFHQYLSSPSTVGPRSEASVETKKASTNQPLRSGLASPFEGPQSFLGMRGADIYLVDTPEVEESGRPFGLGLGLGFGFPDFDGSPSQFAYHQARMNEEFIAQRRWEQETLWHQKDHQGLCEYHHSTPPDEGYVVAWVAPITFPDGKKRAHKCLMTLETASAKGHPIIDMSSETSPPKISTPESPSMPTSTPKVVEAPISRSAKRQEAAKQQKKNKAAAEALRLKEEKKRSEERLKKLTREKKLEEERKKIQQEQRRREAEEAEMVRKSKSLAAKQKEATLKEKKKSLENLGEKNQLKSFASPSKESGIPDPKESIGSIQLNKDSDTSSKASPTPKKSSKVAKSVHQIERKVEEVEEETSFSRTAGAEPDGLLNSTQESCPSSGFAHEKQDSSIAQRVHLGTSTPQSQGQIESFSNSPQSSLLEPDLAGMKIRGRSLQPDISSRNHLSASPLSRSSQAEEANKCNISIPGGSNGRIHSIVDLPKASSPSDSQPSKPEASQSVESSTIGGALVGEENPSIESTVGSLLPPAQLRSSSPLPPAEEISRSRSSLKNRLPEAFHRSSSGTSSRASNPTPPVPREPRAFKEREALRSRSVTPHTLEKTGPADASSTILTSSTYGGSSAGQSSSGRTVPGLPRQQPGTKGRPKKKNREKRLEASKAAALEEKRVADAIRAAEKGETTSHQAQPPRPSKVSKTYRRGSPAQTEGSGSYYTAMSGSDSVSSLFEDGFEGSETGSVQFRVEVVEQVISSHETEEDQVESQVEDQIANRMEHLTLLRPTHSRTSTSTLTGEDSNPPRTSSPSNSHVFEKSVATSPMLRRVLVQDSAILDSGPSSPLYGSPGDATVGTGFTTSISVDTLNSVRTASTTLSSVADSNEEKLHRSYQGHEAARERAAAYYGQGALGIHLNQSMVEGDAAGDSAAVAPVVEEVSDELGIYPSPIPSNHIFVSSPYLNSSVVSSSIVPSLPYSDRDAQHERMSRTADWLQASLNEDRSQVEVEVGWAENLKRSIPIASPLPSFYDSGALLERRAESHPLVPPPALSEWDLAISTLAAFPSWSVQHRMALFVVQRAVSELPSFEDVHRHQSESREDYLKKLSSVDLEEFAGKESTSTSDIWLTHSTESPAKKQRFQGARKSKSKTSQVEKANRTTDCVFPEAADSDGSDSEREELDLTAWKAEAEAEAAQAVEEDCDSSVVDFKSRPPQLLGFFNQRFDPSHRFELAISPSTVGDHGGRDENLDYFSYTEEVAEESSRQYNRSNSEHVNSLLDRFHNGSAGDRCWTRSLQSLDEKEVEGIDSFFAASEEQWREYAGDSLAGPPQYTTQEQFDRLRAEEETPTLEEQEEMDYLIRQTRSRDASQQITNAESNRKALCSSPGPRSGRMHFRPLLPPSSNGSLLDQGRNQEISLERRPQTHQQVQSLDRAHRASPSDHQAQPAAPTTVRSTSSIASEASVLHSTAEWMVYLNLQVSKAIRLRQLYWKENYRCFENGQFKFVNLDPQEEERLFLFSLDQITIRPGLDAVQSMIELNNEQEIVLTEILRRSQDHDAEVERRARSEQQRILQSLELPALSSLDRGIQSHGGSRSVGTSNGSDSGLPTGPRLILTEPTPHRPFRGEGVASQLESHRNQSYPLSLSSSSPFRKDSFDSQPSRGSSPSPMYRARQRQHQPQHHQNQHQHQHQYQQRHHQKQSRQHHQHYPESRMSQQQQVNRPTMLHRSSSDVQPHHYQRG